MGTSSIDWLNVPATPNGAGVYPIDLDPASAMVPAYAFFMPNSLPVSLLNAEMKSLRLKASSKVTTNVPVCVANQAAPDGSLNATQSGWKNSSESTDP